MRKREGDEIDTHTQNRVFAVFPFHQSICASMLRKSVDDLKNIWQQWNTAEYIYLKLQPQLHTLSICSNFCFRKPFHSLLIYFLFINEALTDKTDKNIHYNQKKKISDGCPISVVSQAIAAALSQ